MTIESPHFLFSLDSEDPIRINALEFLIDGWFLPREAAGGESWSLKILVDGTEIPLIEHCHRPDVARESDIEGAESCGFVGLFERPRWEPKVRLIARRGVETFSLAELFVETRSKRQRQKASAPIKTYYDWLVHCEEDLFWRDEEVEDRMKTLGFLPLFSIILPTFNTDAFFIERCIQSVQRQRYANWQLCITDDGSHNPALLEYLQKLADQDSRIIFQRNAKCGGISRASNRSLEVAKGDYVVLLDHDDELHPFALLEVARHLNEVQDTQVVYSDEDKMDLYCRRSQPAFKPEFDLDMFRAFNYLGHLVAVRRDLVQRIGGFRPSADGAQDWDLLMRAIEVAGSASVSHIPKPLYHWRMHEESTSLDLFAKPYVRKAWIHVLQEHLDRVGERATIEPGLAFGTMRLKYELPEDTRVAVFIRTEDGEYQRALLEMLADERFVRLYEVADCVVRPVVQSNSPAGCVSSLAEIPEEVFLFINRPLETVNHVFFEELARQVMRPACGVVTGFSLARDATIAHSGYLGTRSRELKDPFVGLELPEPAYMWQTIVIRRAETISEDFFATHKRNIQAVGGISAISSTRMPQLVDRLVQHAAGEGLRVIVTPFAVATFDEDVREMTTPLPHRSQSGFELNPNLESFSDFDLVVRGRT